VLKGDSCACEIEIALPNFKIIGTLDFILLEVDVSYTVEVCITLTVDLPLKALFPIAVFM